MYRKIVVSILLAFFALTVSAQTSLPTVNNKTVATPEEAELIQLLDSINRLMPMVINQNIDVTKAVYSNGNVTILYGVDEQALNFDAFKSNEAAFKNSLRQMLQSTPLLYKPLLESIAKVKGGFVVAYHSRSSTKKVSIKFTYEEIVELLDSYTTQSTDYEAQLKSQIEMSNLQLPRQIDEFTICKNIAIEGKSVVYYMTILESKEFDMTEIEKGKAQKNFASLIKSGVSASANDPIQFRFFKLVLEAGKGIIYRYVGDHTQKTVDVVITNKELKQLCLAL
ncbi:MAG: hypothetical protein Q4D14_05115 [Bacteroidales bacterium]|nr:hypothetical protein [Bacteroidales bacterium]